MEWILVALGGGIGATLRYAVIKLVTKLDYPIFYSTTFVNLFGSFLLGFVVQSLQYSFLLSFLAIGILGAFTTFSTFAFDLVQLFNNRQYKRTINHLLINLIGGLLLFIVGMYM